MSKEKWKLLDFFFKTDKDWITLIPTIDIDKNNPFWGKKNITLMLHIFIWHFQWIFVKEREDRE